MDLSQNPTQQPPHSITRMVLCTSPRTHRHSRAVPPVYREERLEEEHLSKSKEECQKRSWHCHRIELADPSFSKLPKRLLYRAVGRTQRPFLYAAE